MLSCVRVEIAAAWCIYSADRSFVFAADITASQGLNGPGIRLIAVPRVFPASCLSPTLPRLTVDGSL